MKPNQNTPPRVAVLKRDEVLVVQKTTANSSGKDRRYLENELYVLKALAQQKLASSAHTPKVVAELVNENTTQFSTSFEKGSTLDVLPSAQVYDAVLNCMHFMTETGKCEISPPLGRRGPLALMISGVLFFVTGLIRVPSNFVILFSTLAHFLWEYFFSCDLFEPLVLTHRDLDPNNILLLADGSALITDWENAVLSDRLYDVAQLPRLYKDKLSTTEQRKIMASHIRSVKDARRVQALTRHGILQTLAVDPIDSHMFTDAIATYESMKKHVTFYEHIHAMVFGILVIMKKILPGFFPIANGGFNLCYHAVGYDGWRYSTPPFELSEHLQALSQVADITISFDDGYKNLVTEALPILAKYGKTAMVFLLGDPSHANRIELDNELPLLTPSDVEKLRESDWTLGFHTTTHANLHKLSPDGLKEEIVEGKRLAEQKYKTTMSDFAYPKGAYSPKIRKAVESAGFSHAYLVDGGTLESSWDSLTMNRIPMEANISGDELLILLSPIGILITRFFLRLLQYKQKLVDCILP